MNESQIGQLGKSLGDAGFKNSRFFLNKSCINIDFIYNNMKSGYIISYFL